MPEMVWRVGALAALSLALAISIDFISARALATPSVRPLVVIDHVKKGEHHLNGYLTLPTDCHSFSVHVAKVTSYSYELQFTTWQDTTRDCAPNPVDRHFQAVAFAPSVGVEVIAFVDGTRIPLHIIRARQK